MRPQLAALCVALWCGAAYAHVGAPLGLALDEEAGRVSAMLTRPVAVADRVALELPLDCQLLSTEPLPATAGQVVDRSEYRCADTLRGRALRVAGLAEAGLPALVRYSEGASSHEALLEAACDRWDVPLAGSEGGFVSAVRLGFEHFLQGADHVLFVVGVVLLPLSWRRRVSSLSAFTLGHSVTLALAALGIWVPSAPWVEMGIALSLVVLALEGVRGGAPRAPELVTAGFGLLHGFGFVGAFAGLRPAVSTLLGFNVGIEVAQLGVVLLAVGLGRLATRAMPLAPARVFVAYAMGALAASWCIERALVLVAA